MKNFLIWFLAFNILLSPVFSFVDISPKNVVYDSVQNLISRGNLKDGSFFRPNYEVPFTFWWRLILAETDRFDENFDQDVLDFPKTHEDFYVLNNLYNRGIITNPYLYIDNRHFVSYKEAIKSFFQLNLVPQNRANFREFSRKYKYFMLGFSEEEKVFTNSLFQAEILTEDDIYHFNEFFNRKKAVILINRFINNSSLNNKKQDLITIKYIDEDKLLQNSRKNDNTLNEIFDDILNEYRFSDELTEIKKEIIKNKTIENVIEKLNDDFSEYIPPNSSDDFNQNLNFDSLVGIGIRVGSFHNQFVIYEVFPNSPAQKNGLQDKDIIVSVDDVFTKNLTIQELLNKVKGDENTIVKINILRDNKYLDFYISREKIVLPSAQFNIIDDVVILKISDFSNQTLIDLETIILEKFPKTVPPKIIIDIRNNDGGYVRVLKEIMQLFAKKDDVLYHSDLGEKTITEVSQKNGILSDIPKIIVLQNRFTASAGEILSAFLQETKTATIVGENSYGKGVIQKLFKYSDGGILKLTTSKWLTPNHNWIQKTGVTPDENLKNISLDSLEDLWLNEAVKFAKK